MTISDDFRYMTLLEMLVEDLYDHADGNTACGGNGQSCWDLHDKYERVLMYERYDVNGWMSKHNMTEPFGTPVRRRREAIGTMNKGDVD